MWKARGASRSGLQVCLPHVTRVAFASLLSYIQVIRNSYTHGYTIQDTSMRLMIFVYDLSKMLIALREQYADVLRLLNTISASRIHT